MELKPKVLLIFGEEHGDVVNVDHDCNRQISASALINFLERDLGAEVIQHRWFDLIKKEDLSRLKYLAEHGHLAFVVIAGDKFSLDVDELRRVRENISSFLPAVILADWDCKDKAQEEKGDDDLAWVMSFSSLEAGQKMRELVKSWRPSANFFDAHTTRDVEMLSCALQVAYEKNYLGEHEEFSLAVPDFNGQVVTEALRLRLMPPEVIQKEFDQVVARELSTAETPSIEEGVYQQELQRLRQMSEQDRKIFYDQVEDRFGRYPDGKGGYFSDNDISCGPGLKGFAIDVDSLVFLVTEGFGGHRLASQLLYLKLDELCEYRENQPVERKDQMLGGFVFKLDGWQTPFVSLGDMQYTEKEIRERVLGFLFSSRRFIPLDDENRLLEI